MGAVERGKYKRPGLRIMLGETLDHFNAAEARQSHGHDEQIRAQFQRAMERVEPVIDLGDYLVTFVFDQRAHGMPRKRLPFSDNDPH
jgi:hypothetical protein